VRFVFGFDFYFYLGKTQTKDEQTEQSAEDQNLSFRGALRAEESLFLFAFTPEEIPHFLRKDDRRAFSATAEVCATKTWFAVRCNAAANNYCAKVSR
jgi:hypothetical protein